jgi:hypothetical protein
MHELRECIESASTCRRSISSTASRLLLGAWTSDASKRWAQDWIGWGGYGRFFGQVVRAAQRAVQRPGMRVETDVESGTARVQIDALSSDGSFRNGLSVRGRVVDPDGRTADFDVSQTGPGRYEGKFPASKVGTYLSTLTYQEPDSDGPPSLLTASASVAYSAEHLAQSSDERFFARAQANGATVLDLDDLERRFADDPSTIAPARLPWSGVAKSTSEPLDLWPFIAAVAAFLLVTDVAVRRVRVKFSAPAFLRRRRDARPKAPPGPIARGPATAPTGKYRPEDAVGAAPAVDPPRAGGPPEPGPGAATPSPTGGLLGSKRRAKRRQDWEET